MSRCHMPGPGLPRVPEAECGAAGDEVPENEPLLGLECWVSCGWDPTLLIQMRPPTPQASRVTQTTVDLCAKRALKSHLLPRSPGAGVPTGSLLPRESSRLWTKAPSASPLWRGLGFLRKGQATWKKYQNRSPGLFLLAHSTGSRYPLSLGRWLLKQP